MELRKEPWNLCGQMLQIRVEHDQDRSVRSTRSRQDRLCLAQVGAVTEHAQVYPARTLGPRHIRRPVRGAVVDQENLSGQARSLELGSKLTNQRWNRLRLVVGRHNDGEVPPLVQR